MDTSAEEAVGLLERGAAAGELSGSFSLVVKTEVSPLMNLAALSSTSTIHHTTSREFEITVQPEMSIWAVKVLTSAMFGFAEGFEPYNLHLHLPDRLEMRNEGTVKMYDIPEGSSIICVPEPPSINAADSNSPKKQASKIDRAGSKGFLQKRRERASSNSFASGRGLNRALAHYASTLEVHPITKSFRPGFTADDKFAIEVRCAASGVVQTIDANISFQKTKGCWLVSYTVKAPGLYRLDVTLGGKPILHSPFPLTVCPVPSLSFALQLIEHDWAPEAARVIARYALDNARREAIVSDVGVRALVLLARDLDERHHAHIKCILAHILRNGLVQQRFVRELDAAAVFRVVDLRFWTGDAALGAFVGRLLSLVLQRSKQGRELFVEGRAWCLEELWRFRTEECAFYCATIVLFLASGGHAKAEQPLIVDLLWGMAQHFRASESVLVQVLRALSAVTREKWSHTYQAIEPAALCGLCEGQSSTVLAYALELALQLVGDPSYRAKAAACAAFSRCLEACVRLPFDTADWEDLSALSAAHMVDEPLTPAPLDDAMHRQNVACMRVLRALVAGDPPLEGSGDGTGEAAPGAMAAQLARLADAGGFVERVGRLCGVPDVAVVEAAVGVLSVVYDDEQLRAQHMTAHTLTWLLTSATAAMVLNNRKIRAALAKLCALLSPESTSPFGEVAVSLAQDMPTLPADAQAEVAQILAHVGKHVVYGAEILARGGATFVELVMKNARDGHVALPSTVNREQVSVGDLLASGPGSKVYRAVWHQTKFALKQFDLEASLGFDLGEFYVEVALGCLLRHKRLAHCVGGDLAGDRPFILFKYFERGSVADAIQRCPEELTEPRALSMALDVAQGMEYLHSLGIIHRDLKPGNLFLTEDWRVCVGDFGISRSVAKHMTPVKGTPQFMAPELYNNDKYDLKADVYSFAMVLWTMLEKKIPFENMRAIDVLIAAKDGTRPEFSSSSNRKGVLGMLAQRCWAPDPKDRPSFSQMVHELREAYSSAIAQKRHQRTGSEAMGGGHKRKPSVLSGAHLAPLIEDVGLERSTSWDMEPPESGAASRRTPPDATLTDVEIAQFRAPDYLEEMKVRDTSDRLEEMDVPDDDDDEGDAMVMARPPVARSVLGELSETPPSSNENSPVLSRSKSGEKKRKKSKKRSASDRRRDKDKDRSQVGRTISAEGQSATDSDDTTARRKKGSREGSSGRRRKRSTQDEPEEEQVMRSRVMAETGARPASGSVPAPIVRKRSGSWSGDLNLERKKSNSWTGVADEEPKLSKKKSGSWTAVGRKKSGSWTSLGSSAPVHDEVPPGISMAELQRSNDEGRSSLVRSMLNSLPGEEPTLSSSDPTAGSSSDRLLSRPGSSLRSAETSKRSLARSPLSQKRSESGHRRRNSDAKPPKSKTMKRKTGEGIDDPVSPRHSPVSASPLSSPRTKGSPRSVDSPRKHSPRTHSPRKHSPRKHSPRTKDKGSPRSALLRHASDSGSDSGSGSGEGKKKKRKGSDRESRERERAREKSDKREEKRERQRAREEKKERERKERDARDRRVSRLELPADSNADLPTSSPRRLVKVLKDKYEKLGRT